LAAKILGRSGQFEQLTGNLRVDDEMIRRELGWVPPYSIHQSYADVNASGHR
jgi:hypothetical protein